MLKAENLNSLSKQNAILLIPVGFLKCNNLEQLEVGKRIGIQEMLENTIFSLAFYITLK